MIKNLLFTLCFFISSQALAQRALDKDQPAPEDGVFYTNIEAAKMIADRKALKERHELELKSQKEELKIICDGEKKIKDLYLEMEKERTELVSGLKDKQIENLYKQLENESDDYSMLWLAGGIVVGAAGSIAIFFAATQIQQTPSFLSGQ